MFLKHYTVHLCGIQVSTSSCESGYLGKPCSHNCLVSLGNGSKRQIELMQPHILGKGNKLNHQARISISPAKVNTQDYTWGQWCAAHHFKTPSKSIGSIFSSMRVASEPATIYDYWCHRTPMCMSADVACIQVLRVFMVSSNLKPPIPSPPSPIV